MLIISLYLIVCSLFCEPSYAPDPSCSICVLINICEAETPCENSGVCILGSQPNGVTPLTLDIQEQTVLVCFNQALLFQYDYRAHMIIKISKKCF